jgi:hypothetical protein
MEALPQMNEVQSNQLAAMISGIAFYARTIDLDYLKLSEESFNNQASFQDSTAIINRNYNPEKNNALRLSAKALYILHEYIITLKEIDEAKRQAALYDDQADKIAALFI